MPSVITPLTSSDPTPTRPVDSDQNPQPARQRVKYSTLSPLPGNTVQYFLQTYITPTVLALPLPSPLQAIQLLLGTAIQESHLVHLKQINGPAVSVYQLEPATIQDLIPYFRLRLPSQFMHYAIRYGIPLDPDLSMTQSVSHLWTFAATFDHALATTLSRLYYYRIPVPLPEDLTNQALYWKKYYNTPKGRGTPQQYMDSFKKYASSIQWPLISPS